MVGTPLEAMMAQSLGTIVSSNEILALIVLVLFGGFALIGGGGLDRKVAIIVAGSLLAACLVPWLFIVVGLIIGAVLFYPLLRRLFG